VLLAGHGRRGFTALPVLFSALPLSFVHGQRLGCVGFDCYLRSRPAMLPASPAIFQTIDAFPSARRSRPSVQHTRLATYSFTSMRKGSNAES